MRCAAARNEEPLRRRAAPSQLSRQLERDEGAHTVAEQGERPIDEPTESGCYFIDERRQRRVRTLSDAVFAAREPNGTHLDGWWQRGGPLAKHRRAAAGVRQTKEANSRRRTAAGTDRLVHDVVTETRV
jgi:hypothetical protein